jgi:nicotinamide-nucleotide amidase
VKSGRVELITIGDELLLGFTIDTNAAHIARALGEIGWDLVRRATVGDRPDEIVSAVGDALARTGAVITTGGLGPTADDLTKASIARIFGRAMLLDELVLRQIEERWERLFPGRHFPAPNRAQAAVPEGARIMINRHGSAPGIWIDDSEERWVAMLPGVPREMRGMLADELLPILKSRSGDLVILSKTLRTTGIGESAIAEILGNDPLAAMSSELPLSLAYLPSPLGADLRLTVRRAPREVAEQALQSAAMKLRAQVAPYVYGEDDADLAAVVLDLCRAKQLSVAVAESCTGGMLGQRITAVPGSSDVFRGGVIAYHDELKQKLLDVTPATLERHGAVSVETATELARAAREKLGAGAGMAITGVAGPGGGTPEKPVGTVCIAIDTGSQRSAKAYRLIGDRDEIRQRAVQAALDMLRRALQGL